MPRQVELPELPEPVCQVEHARGFRTALPPQPSKKGRGKRVSHQTYLTPPQAVLLLPERGDADAPDEEGMPEDIKAKYQAVYKAELGCI